MVSVVAGIVIHGGKILISQRPAGKHLEGMWEFPGGKVQVGESHEIALRRELSEELGINAIIGPEFHFVDHKYPEKWVKIWFYLCGVESGEPSSLERNPFKWIDLEELSQFKFPPADACLLEDLRNSSISELQASLK